MTINAIVYRSNAGHTKAYAELFSAQVGLPLFELSEAKKCLAKASPVVFMGWLMAGNVRGYKQAAKLFDVQAVCGVGMAHGASQLEEIRKVNKLPDALPVFYLQGGFELDKLHGVFKCMMKAMRKSVLKKESHNAEEAEMLELMRNGGNCVSAEHLSDILKWIRNEAQ